MNVPNPQPPVPWPQRALAALGQAVGWVLHRLPEISLFLPEISLLLLLLVLASGLVQILGSSRTRAAAGAGNFPQLQLKASDLASGAAIAQPKSCVSLILVEESGEGADKKVTTTPYYNLRVDDLRGADGRSVSYTGAPPDQILLAVPDELLDPLIKGLQRKKAAYLLPQVRAITPTAAPSPKATLASTTTFVLPASLIQPPDMVLAAGSDVSLIVVGERRDADGKVVTNESSRFVGTLPSGLPAYPTVPTADVRVKVERGPQDATAMELASKLPGATRIYVLAQPTATAAPTAAETLTSTTKTGPTTAPTPTSTTVMPSPTAAPARSPCS